LLYQFIVATDSPTRLAFVWNPTIASLSVYVDGSLHERISQPQTRLFYGLNYAPFKHVRLVDPLDSSAQQVAELNEALFNDSSLAESHEAIQGSLASYLRGCVRLDADDDEDENKSKRATALKPFVLSDDKPPNVICKQLCLEETNQVSFAFSFYYYSIT
jgi:hypothetical protein